MDVNVINELKSGLSAAYINGSVAANLAYKPAFVSNNPEEGKKVISSVEDELLRCDQFQVSVAFITMGGVTPLLQTLKELEKKGVKGQILTTNYLNFSEPRALEKLNGLKNITLKMYDVEAAGNGFHTKGYIFKKEEVYRIIIGSSNMTSAALTVNKEWNTKLISTESGEVAEEIVEEFHSLWNSEYALPYEDFYEVYKERYNIIKHQREIAKSEEIPSIEKYRLKPNSMQERFIANLRNILGQGEERALLISATGTGKTYASAFAMRELGFKRVLFLVHRVTLAKQAKKSFEKVFDKKVTMGLVGAGSYEYEKDYVFATVETLNRDAHLFQYQPDAFDCIILDEAHHSSNNIYTKVIDYFNPKLFLGMTATPDKRDDNQEGKNIYEIFHYQIAHEIRLQQAMEEDLLCPFHYFGISEVVSLDDKTLQATKLTDDEFNQLTSDERVKHVIEQSEYYGYSGDRVRGLVFCSRVKECEELSRKFNALGYRTIALSGADSEEKRQKAFERLAMDEADTTEEMQPLDYIFSRDILNEGVDIASLDMVMFLRPTESPTVFLQQLGRGLRISKGKEYVNVLDFIGNYEKAGRAPFLLNGGACVGERTAYDYSEIEYPDDCIVDFDMRLIDLFREMDKKSLSIQERIKQEYYRVKELLDGKVPTRMELFTNMDDNIYEYCMKHSKENPFKRYMDFLYEIHELSVEELQIYSGIGREFLQLIETTDMQKVYKMPILYGFYNEGDVRLAVTDDEVVESWKKFFDRGTNWKDFPKVTSYEEYRKITDKQHLSKAKSMPIKFLKASGKGFFIDKDGYALGIRDELADVIKADAFKHQMKDIIEYRTMEYYRRRYVEN